MNQRATPGVPSPQAVGWLSAHCLIGTRSHSRCRHVGRNRSVLCISSHFPWKHHHLRPTSCGISVALDSHRSLSPTLNCACEGSRSALLYENLTLKPPPPQHSSPTPHPHSTFLPPHGKITFPRTDTWYQTVRDHRSLGTEQEVRKSKPVPCVDLCPSWALLMQMSSLPC